MMLLLCIILFILGQVESKERKISLLDPPRYLTLNETYDFLKKLKTVSTDDYDLKVLGTTHMEEKDYENDIYLVTIGDKSKPVIFFDCGIHAREWISPATCLFVIERLVGFFKYGRKSRPKSSVFKFQWQFIPMMNPDGYQKSHTKDRSHRKNDRPYDAKLFNKEQINECRCNENPERCSGVDLNRNFPAGWGLGTESKYSSLPCKDIYKGPKPLSEPETQIMDKHLRSLGNQIIGAFSIHSFGKQIVHAKGWLSDDDEDQVKGEERKLLDDFARLINKALQFNDNMIGNVARVMGKEAISGGATDDYYYTILNINVSYTIELDPQAGDKQYEWRLPEDNIVPIGLKMWRAVQRMAVGFNQLYPNA